MPVITGGFNVELRLKGLCIAQEIINVFHFHSSTFTDPITDLLTTFTTGLFTLLTPMTSNVVTWTSCEGQEVGGAGAFGSIPLAVDGAAGGESLPPFASWDFTYIRGAALERNGYKRFAGIPESLQSSGIATPTGAAQAALVAAYLNTAVTLSVDIWFPAIMRKKVNRIAQNPPKFYSVSSVIYSKIGSQNSRKFGHGR